MKLRVCVKQIFFIPIISSLLKRETYQDETYQDTHNNLLKCYIPVIAKSIAAIISSLNDSTDPTGFLSSFDGIEAS